MEPKNYADYVELTKNVQDLVCFLQEKEILPKEQYCTKCNSRMKIFYRNENPQWMCYNKIKKSNKKEKYCRNTASIRKGTWFGQSVLSLKTITLLTYLIICKMGNTTRIAKELNLSTHTVCDWINFVREAILEWYMDHAQPIGGAGKTVEIDESKFGKRKYNRGKYVEGQWIFGGIERESGQVFMVPVESRDENTLINLIKQWILPGTTIISDGWKGYLNIQNEGYKHLTVNHNLYFKDPTTGAHINNVEALWRAAKSTMPSSGRRKHLYASYLAHYIFDKHCKMTKKNEIDFFWQIVKNIKYTDKTHTDTATPTEPLPSTSKQ